MEAEGIWGQERDQQSSKIGEKPQLFYYDSETNHNSSNLIP